MHASVHAEQRRGRPSLVSDDFVQKIDKIIREERRRTWDEIREKCAEVSRTLLYDVVSNHLNYRKLCSRWVLKMHTKKHKKTELRQESCFLSVLMKDRVF